MGLIRKLPLAHRCPRGFDNLCRGSHRSVLLRHAAFCRAMLESADGQNKTPANHLICGRSVLATSYSRTAYRRTTIGAAAFHCRVRNGNGWCHCATVTRVRSRTGGFLISQRSERETESL